MSIRFSAVFRQFAWALVCTALILGLVVATIYRQDVVHQGSMLEREAAHVLDLQRELLLFEFAAVESDLLYLAAQDRLGLFLSGRQSEVREELERDYANFAQKRAVYDQIRCLDTSGQEIIRVNCRDGKTEIVPVEQLQEKANRYYYQQALTLHAGEVFVSEFDLNVEHGRIQSPINPVIRFLTPVFDQAGEKRGLLALNYLGAQLLRKMRQISQGFRGDTMIVNAEGQFLQADDPRHEWGWLLAHPHSFDQRFPSAWNEFRQNGVQQVATDRGTFSFQPIGLGKKLLSTSMADATHGSLILVSYISPTVSHARSRNLLGQLAFMYLGVMAAVALLLWHWARANELRQHHERRLMESESRLRQLSSRLLAAQEAERQHLSRDLHDELCQQVTALSLDLRSLQRSHRQMADAPLLERAIDEADGLLRNLHEIARRIRPKVLDDLGLQEAVESLLSEFQQRTEIRVKSDVQLQRKRIPHAIGENTYRVLQEALANVAAHAQIDQVEVMMEAGDDLLFLSVSDRGAGFEPETTGPMQRLGLLGMRERVELLNGQFQLESAPGRGTRIRAVIPLPQDS